MYFFSMRCYPKNALFVVFSWFISFPFWETFLFFESEKFSILSNPNPFAKVQNYPKTTITLCRNLLQNYVKKKSQTYPQASERPHYEPLTNYD